MVEDGRILTRKTLLNWEPIRGVLPVYGAFCRLLPFSCSVYCNCV